MRASQKKVSSALLGFVLFFCGAEADAQVSCPAGTEPYVIDAGDSTYVTCEVISTIPYPTGRGSTIVFTESPGGLMGQGMARTLEVTRIPSEMIPQVQGNFGSAVAVGLTRGTTFVGVRGLEMLQRMIVRVQVEAGVRNLVAALRPFSAGLPTAQGWIRRNGGGSVAAGDGVSAGTDPVDLSNGEFIHSVVDLALPAAGISFEHRRTYRSRVSLDGVLGHGWDHAYNRRIETGWETRLATGVGTTQRFVPKAASRFQIPGTQVLLITVDFESADGALLRLERRTEEHVNGYVYWTAWTLRSDDGTKAHFLFDGTLARLEDRNGRGLAFIWEEGPLGPRVQRVTDAAQRVVTYTYDSGGRLRTVTGPGVQASYDYDEAGDLRRAVDARGVVETYEYTGAVTNPDVGGVPPTGVESACAQICERASCPQALANVARVCEEECQVHCAPDCLFGCVANDACGCRQVCQAPCASSCEAEALNLCFEAYNDGVAGQCLHCQATCETKCEDACANREERGDVDTYHCAANCAACCTYGNCPSESCQDNHGCFDECTEGFLYGTTDSECASTSEAGCHALMPGLCKDVCVDDCKGQCRVTPECFNGCVEGCAEGCDDCEARCAQPAKDSCQATCTSACVAAERAKGPTYGVQGDLAHNLLRIRNGADELLLENEYGTLLSDGSFDSVVVQRFGGYTVSLAYRDLAAEQAGLVPPPTSGVLATHVESPASFVPRTICRWYTTWSLDAALSGQGPRPARATVVTDPYGVARTYYYDDRGRTLREVNQATTAVRSYEYDERSRLVGVEDAMGGRVCVKRAFWDSPPQNEKTRVVIASGPTLYQHPIVSETVEAVATKTAPRRLWWALDPTGGVRWFDHDAKGNLVRIRDDSGATLLDRTLTSGLVYREVDGYGGIDAQFLRDDAGLVERETLGTGPGAETTQILRDSAGRVRETTSPLGEVTRTVWPASPAGGLPTAVERLHDGLLERTDIAYDAAQRPWRLTRGQRQVELTYDVFGEVIRRHHRALDGTAPDAIECFRYGPGGRLLEQVGPEGERVRYTHDADGRVLKVEAGAPGGHPDTWDDLCIERSDTPWLVLVEIRYDRAGRWVQRWTAEEEGWTEVLRDGLGNPWRLQTPRGTIVQFGWDGLGRLAWQMVRRDSPGNWPPSPTDAGVVAATELVYDARGHFREIRQLHAHAGVPRGDGWLTTRFAPDVGGRMTVTDDTGSTTVIERDGAGHEIRRTLPTGEVITTEHDFSARTITRTTPTNNTMDVDALIERVQLTQTGNVAALTSNDELVASQLFDLHDRPYLSYARWHGWSWLVHDAFDRLRQRQSGGETETLDWDRSGRGISYDSNGVTTEIDYDALGRAWRERRPEGRVRQREFILGSRRPLWETGDLPLRYFGYSYGQLRTIWSGSESHVFDRDDLGRIKRATRSNGTQGTSVVDREFDTAGNLAREKTTLGTEVVADVAVEYSARGRTRVGPFSWARDSLGRATGISMGATSIATADYEGLFGPGRLSRANGLSSFYFYDAQGRRKVSVDIRSPVLSDPWVAARSTQWYVDEQRVNESFGGPFGAPAIPPPSLTARHDLDDRGRLVTELHTLPTGGIVVHRTYEVDARANWESWTDEVTSETVWPWRDGEDGLVHFRDTIDRDGRGFAIGHAGEEWFIWSPLGELERVETTEHVVAYRYDPFGRLLTRTVDGTETDRLAWVDDQVVYHRTAGHTGTWIVPGDGPDEHVARVNGANGQGEEWFHQDHAGSVYLVTGPDGNARDWTWNTAFGETLRFGGTAPEGLTFGFQGHLTDPLTGLVSMRARWYRPEWGQFLSPDPIGLAGGNHAFGFVGGSPLLYVDPYGLSPQDPRPGGTRGPTGDPFVRFHLAPLLALGGLAEVTVEGAQELADMRTDLEGLGSEWLCGYTGWCAYVHNTRSQAGAVGIAGETPSVFDKLDELGFVLITAPGRAYDAIVAGDMRALGRELPNLYMLGQAVAAAGRVVGTLGPKGAGPGTLVCRGGLCTAKSFTDGSGVVTAADGTLSGVSTQSRVGASVETLAQPFKNGQVGVTTVEQIEAAGGRVVFDGRVDNPNHATVSGITAQQAERLFTPVVPNPVPKALRGTYPAMTPNH